jgi:thiosulfate/3-mercaptopyruvate sulfurtransferase
MLTVPPSNRFIRFLAKILPGLCLGGAVHAASLPGPLVNVAWLHDHSSAVQIVDIRDDVNSLTSDPQFETRDGHKILIKVGGYIPGALSVNFWALRDKREIDGQAIHFLPPSPKNFQEVMQASLLEPDRPIVLVPTGDDSGSLQEAAYLAWELQLMGVKDDQLAILNGGTHAWIAAGYSVDTDAIAPMSTGHWLAKPVNSAFLATTPQVLQAARTPGQPLLIDARPIAQYVGVEKSIVATRPGRIPSAHPLPPSALYRVADDGSARFLTMAQYRALIPLFSLPSKGAMIVYCNTGQYAASVWFIMHRLLGNDQVRVYPGSINEWTHLNEPLSELPG